MNNLLIPQKTSLSGPHNQTGAVLAIALILLVVVTLLGISSVKTVSQQEKMVSHSNDRSLAYQFAEAALREGEAQARIQALNLNSGFPNPVNQYIANGNACANNDPSFNDCVNGLCNTPDPDCAPRWTNPAFNGWTNYNTVAAVLSASGNTLSGQPQYFIEILRPTDATCVPGAQSFDMACNQRYPDPDLEYPCSATFPATSGFQWCNFYRYRVTARVAQQDRAAVVLQSILSVQPN